jgi:hypothetical protein
VPDSPLFSESGLFLLELSFLDSRNTAFLHHGKDDYRKRSHPPRKEFET